uniref:Uncharacterized protein n=1 Tax=Anguilla anguilla TaxID=7936 RepID=A0A0E9S9N3_ANGAN
MTLNRSTSHTSSAVEVNQQQKLREAAKGRRHNISPANCPSVFANLSIIMGNEMYGE